MKDQRSSLDIISTLPPTIIETILCLVPIKEAVRTSILSREWRYIWTKIPKLVFNEDMFEATINENQLPSLDQIYKGPVNERKKMSKRFKLFYAIYRVFLFHQGPISEFTLSMDADYTCAIIDQIVMHLARKNTLSKLYLKCSYMLPVFVNSMQQLTDLYLQYCDLDNGQTFTGFASLTSLYMDHVFISRKVLLNLLSKCPLLKSFTMITEYNSSLINVIELFECLPVIEQLAFSIRNLQCFIQGTVPRELPTSLVHLTALSLEGMCFLDKYGLPILVILIRSSPNLEKLKLKIHCEDMAHYFEDEADYVTLQDYSDIWLAHLIELEIGNIGNYLKVELEFVKLILAKSPVLKKIDIVVDSWADTDEELKKVGILFHSPRASPEVEIIVKHFDGSKHWWR